MVNITMKQLLEAGVHFGHQSRRWNPKMKPYIYTERNGIYIIDLKKTLKMLRDACKYVRDAVADGKTVLFVGSRGTGFAGPLAAPLEGERAKPEGARRSRFGGDPISCARRRSPQPRCAEPRCSA